ncbi:MAG: hypothetical protein Q7N50_04800 [Armatimonadota bacterium]|nr:hypothetical protein [Armatimonadota bacterium]
MIDLKTIAENGQHPGGPTDTEALIQQVLAELLTIKNTLRAAPRLPTIKGPTYSVLANYLSTSDFTPNDVNAWADCQGFNALHVDIIAPYSGRFANFLVMGAEAPGGAAAFALPSPLARLGAVNQNFSMDVPVSTRFASVRVQDITAVDATLPGYTVNAYPYISDGPIIPFSRGPFDLLPTTTISVNTASTIFRAAGNIGFSHYSSLIFVLTLTNSLSASGAVNLRISTSIDGTNGNFDDIVSFLQAAAAALPTGVYVARVAQAATGFNDRAVVTALTAQTRVDYFADRLRVSYVAASLGGSVIARIQVYGVV